MSFRRKAPGAASTLRSGTKPFLNGQTLVSSGLSELDAVLGGGLLLGTLNVVEMAVSQSDGAFDLGASSREALATDLLRYFVAEGVADGKQRVVVVAPDARDFIDHQLPLELSLAQRQVRQQLTQSEDAKLTIAWQYGKYEQRSGQTKPRFCHSFDLSKPMHREMLEANEPMAIDPLSGSGTSVDEVYERLLLAVEQLAAQQKEDGDDQVLRIAVLGLGSPLLGPADSKHMTALFKLLRRLRVRVSESKAVCLAVLGSDVLAAFPAAFVNELRHVGDSVLTLSSFAGTRDLLPQELQDFQGSLTLRKLPRVHALACHAPSNTRFGVKREHRKLKIDKFHLPPEGSRSSGCGGQTASSTDPLAF